MEVPIKTVSTAALGQLRPPSDADIQRSITANSRSPAQKQANTKAMAQLEKAAMRFVAMQQQGRQQPAPQQQQSAAQKTPAKAPPRHHSVTPAGYGKQTAQSSRGRARTPEHVAIQRSIQGHIQRNVQREARNERFRQVGQQVKAKAAGMVQQVGRAARSVAPPALSRVQSELAGKQKMQSMTRHREQVMDKGKGKETEKVKSKERASVQIAAPARQPQQTQGKGKDRGRSR